MTTILSVKQLRKTFTKADGSTFTAVNNISFDVHRGEIFSFLGPNGAGKSTTINMITTQLTPTAGEILINGQAIQADPIQARRQIGVVAQYNNLDRGLTAYENLLYHGLYFGMTPTAAAQRATELLTAFGLSNWRDEHVASFSGGMVQRLKIARAMMHKPALLILDEPTTGLDPAYRDVLWEQVLRLRNENHTTVFLTTHYMAEPERFSDRIAIYHHGQIQALGTLEELKNLVPAQHRITATLATLPEAFVNQLQTDSQIKSVTRAGQQGLILYVQQQTDFLTRFLKLVAQAHLKLQSIQLNTTSLDDIFVYLTQKEGTHVN